MRGTSGRLPQWAPVEAINAIEGGDDMPTGFPPKSPRPRTTWRNIGLTTCYLSLISYLRLRLWLISLGSPNKAPRSWPVFVEILAAAVLAVIASAVITWLVQLAISF
jgi:hypothetical protein